MKDYTLDLHTVVLRDLERKVLRMVYDGYTTDEIAKRLRIPRGTAAKMRFLLLRLFDARNVAILIRKVKDARIFDEDSTLSA